MGEGQGGGDDANFSDCRTFPLPLAPSHQERGNQGYTNIPTTRSIAFIPTNGAMIPPAP